MLTSPALGSAVPVGEATRSEARVRLMSVILDRFPPDSGRALTVTHGSVTRDYPVRYTLSAPGEDTSPHVGRVLLCA